MRIKRRIRAAIVEVRGEIPGSIHASERMVQEYGSGIDEKSESEVGEKN